VQAKEMRVVLRMATNAALTVYYDRVQVEERNHLTRWDAKTTLRYEHDLVPFKPQGDVIVLGFSDIAGVSKVQVNNTTWFESSLSLTDGRVKAMFGWEPRVNDANDMLRQKKLAASHPIRITIHRNGHLPTRFAIRCREVLVTHVHQRSTTSSIMGSRGRQRGSLSFLIFLTERKSALSADRGIPTVFAWVARQYRQRSLHTVEPGSTTKTRGSVLRSR
jgi:hypothetical protein